MTDPLGLINSNVGSATAGINRPQTPVGPVGPGQGRGPNFKDVLMENIDKVNELQNDARSSMEDWTAGRRGDIEGVMLATEQAETAFKMLQAVRNKVVQAYEEIQQIRV